MARLQVLTAAEQVVKYLQGELLRGTWSGKMPGGDRLAAELGIGRDTVEAALQRLEMEGYLVNQGRRRGRSISLPSGGKRTSGIKVAILLSEHADRKLDYVLEIQHELTNAGHTVIFTKQSMATLEMDVARIARSVRATAADAWIVGAAGREVLEWFAQQRVPAFALFGRRRGLRIAGAGPDKPPLIAAATRALIEQGHQKIVLWARARRRRPQPGASEQAFLDELAAHGIEPSPYHMPDWRETYKGLNERLESLFSLTPPSAVIIQEDTFYVAFLQFLASKGIRVPQDVSLICTDSSRVFDWCQPSVAHIAWDSQLLVRHIVRWAANVGRGKPDFRQTLTPARFVLGGSIGPYLQE